MLPIFRLFSSQLNTTLAATLIRVAAKWDELPDLVLGSAEVA
jgi:hypothetical protein